MAVLRSVLNRHGWQAHLESQYRLAGTIDSCLVPKTGVFCCEVSVNLVTNLTVEQRLGGGTAC
jgi:hypothetical protein